MTASIAHPPIKASDRFRVKPALVHRAERTTFVAAVISGPIPSPGRRVTSYVSFLDTAWRVVEEVVVVVWNGVGANADADATRSAAIDSFMVWCIIMI